MPGDDSTRWNRERQESIREIGPPPDVVNQQRRDECRYDLLRYLTTYHPSAFDYDFSQDHLELIRYAQTVLLEGGRVVAAMPRGSGKTTIFQRAEIWAALYGHRKYPMILNADDGKFKNLLKGIKTILANNEMLLEDFPEVLHPIRSLEGIANRANFQMCRGEPTYMRWGTEQVIFPTTEWTQKAGNASVVIGGGGLTGAAMRGSVLTLPDGSQRRPDCVLIDDPQTRKSAKSPSQNQEREDIINGDVMGMAGPGKEIALLCAVTVIYQGDLAERLLDRERFPGVKSVRVAMIKSWPQHMDLWDKYDGVRRKELLGEEPEGSTNACYEANREKLEAGAKVYWEERVLPGRLTALQSAMDEYYQDPRSFMAEKQNSPEAQVSGDLLKLTPLTLTKRINHCPRGVVPSDVTTITAHIDVQGKLLYWMVVGWTQKFGGHILDYGTTPQQSRRHFNLQQVKRGMMEHYKLDEKAALRQAIKDTTEMLSNRTFKREDGAELHLERGLIDARWNTDEVEAGLQLSDATNWSPCYGVGIRAKDAPIERWTKKPNTKLGHKFVIQKPAKRLFLSISYDTNFWKNEAHTGLSNPPASQDAILLYKDAQSHHQMLADQLCSENAVRVSARDRVVDEWELPSNKPDNHYWDNLVANMVAASACGIQKESTKNGRPQQPNRKPKKDRVRKLSM